MRLQRLKNLRTKVFRCAEALHRRMVKKHVLVLGDSHAAVFLNIYWRFALPRCGLRTVSVGGATASGAQNPNSTTQAFTRYETALSRKDYAGVIVTLGEVDTGFLIWLRAQTKGVSVDDSYAKTLERYCSFLQNVKSYAPICVVSTPLPTIGDSVEVGWGEIANLRQEVKATQRQRTDLTMRFNADVQDFCIENGMHFISLDAQSLGEDGLVKRSLLNRDTRDHHYQDLPYCRMLKLPLRAWLKAKCER